MYVMNPLALIPLVINPLGPGYYFNTFCDEELLYQLLPLQEKAIRIGSGSAGILVKNGDEEYVLRQKNSNFVFDTNNGIVAWSNPTGMYVLPSEDGITELLQSAGYTNGLSVPFSNGDYPVDFREKWLTLRAEQHYQKRLKGLTFLVNMTTKLGKLQLSSDIIDMYLMEVPAAGLKYISKNGKIEHFFPKCCENLTSNAPCIGSYYRQNGVIVIIDTFGRTFVGLEKAPILEAVENYRYTKYPQQVPFSNGEHPLDPHYKARWELLTEESCN